MKSTQERTVKPKKVAARRTAAQRLRWVHNVGDARIDGRRSRGEAPIWEIIRAQKEEEAKARRAELLVRDMGMKFRGEAPIMARLRAQEKLSSK